MRYVKEYLNEKFTDESDPIKDMGIGLEHKFNEYAKKGGWKITQSKDSENAVINLMDDLLNKELDIEENLILLDYAIKTKIKDKNSILIRSSILDSIQSKEESKISVEIIKVFINNGLDIYKNGSILVHAVEYADMDESYGLIVPEFLIKMGADVNSCSKEIIEDTLYNASTKIRFLLKHGLKINNNDICGLILKYALDANEKDLIDMAIIAYVKINNVEIK